MAGFLIGKDGTGFIWSQDDDEPFDPEIYLERDEQGTFAVPADPCYFAIELGERTADETIEAIKRNPSQTVSRQALSDFFQSKLNGLSDDPRIKRYLLKLVQATCRCCLRDTTHGSWATNRSW